MAKVQESRPEVVSSPNGAAPLARGAVLREAAKPRWGPLVSLAVIVILIVAHVIGWRESQVDLGSLVHDGPKMGRIVAQLLAPDVLSQDQAQMRVSADIIGGQTADPKATPVAVTQPVQPLFLVPGEDPIPLTGTEAMAANLTVDPGIVAPGQAVKVSGHFNIPAGYGGAKQGDIKWQPFGSQVPKTMATFQTDGAGNFTANFTAPDSSEVLESNKLAATLNWGVGNARFSDTLLAVKDSIVQTIFLALMGTSFAVVFSLPISFFAARNITGQSPVGRIIYLVARTLLNLLRSVEVLIMAIIFVAAVGIGPFAGMLALMIHSIASLGKLYSEAIESIDAGPIEAITATGAGRLQTIVFAIIPQFIPQFVSFTLYRWDVNVRMATIIGLVGGGGIGLLLTQFIGLGDWHKAGTAIGAIAIVVILIDLASARIRQAVI